MAGIDGSFRAACEHVMRVLRDSRDALMAVLEAFVHDPLINWRLVSSPTHSHSHSQAHSSHGNSQRTPVSLAHAAQLPREQGFSLTHALAQHLRPADLSTSSGSEGGAHVDEGEDAVDAHVGEAARELDALRSKPSPHHARASSALGASAASASVHAASDERGHGAVNERALAVIGRVDKKLSGRDFAGGAAALSVQQQVGKLIAQATAPENLCQGYYEGWLPFY